jgi:hypothetical protein
VFGLLSGVSAMAQDGASARAPAGSPAGLPPEGASVPRLDLRPGDLRRHVPRDELAAPWTVELDEVVIRPRRQPPDLPERRAVPQGLGGLLWAAKRPTQAWRLLVPDPNAPPVPPRSSDDPRESPGAYRSSIGEPGRVF